MPSYTLRDDGLAEVTLDNGRTLAMALDPATLEAAGVLPGTPQQAQPNLYPEVGPPPAPGPDLRLAQQSTPEQNMSVAPPPAPTTPAAPASPAPRPEEQKAGMSFSPPAQPGIRAVPDGPAGLPPAAGPPPAIETQVSTTSTGGSQSSSGSTDSQSRMVKRPGAVTALGEQEQEDVAEGRIDTQLAAQEVSEQAARAKQEQGMFQTGEMLRLQSEKEEAIKRKAFVQGKFDDMNRQIESKLAGIQYGNVRGTPRERFMKDRGAFSNVLAVIGTILAAPAMQYLNGRNLAQEALDRGAQDEADRQRALWDEVQDARSFMGQMIAQGMSPDTAQETVRILSKAELEARMSAWASRHESEAIRNKFSLEVAESAEKRQQEMIGLKDRLAGDIVEQAQKSRESSAQRSTQTSTQQAIKTGAPAGPSDKMKIAEQDRSLVLPDGRRAWAADQKRAQEAESKLNAIARIQKNMARLQELLDAHPVFTKMPSGIQGEAEALIQDTVALGKDALVLGAITAPDQKLIFPLAGAGVTAFWSMPPKQKDQLRAARRAWQRGADQTMQTLHLDPENKKRVLAPTPSKTSPTSASAHGGFEP